MGAGTGSGSKGSRLATWIFVAAVAGVLAGWAANAMAPDAAGAATTCRTSSCG